MINHPILYVSLCKEVHVIMLHTDHKPLLKIFAPHSATLVLAAARLQRWLLLLSSHQYEICQKSCADIANADAHRTDASVEEHIFSISDQRLNCHPVSAKQITRETAHNEVLCKVFTQHGWSQTCDNPDLKPYFNRRNKISAEQGCLLWGPCIIIPPKFQKQVLSMLHVSTRSASYPLVLAKPWVYNQYVTLHFWPLWFA
jgi:hypothetical protein